MQFTNTSTFGFQAAFRGMRNPLNSWDKSDSTFGFCRGDSEDDIDILNAWQDHDNNYTDQYVAEKLAWLDNNGILEYDSATDCMAYAFIGPNDLSLAQRLIKSGPEHAKFLRMIHT